MRKRNHHDSGAAHLVERLALSADFSKAAIFDYARGIKELPRDEFQRLAEAAGGAQKLAKLLPTILQAAQPAPA